MNQREKILALAIGGLLGLGVAGFGIRAVIVKPLKELDRRTAVLREKLGKIKAERRAYFAAEDQVKDFARQTFAETVDQASARSGEMLTRQILQSGLQESDFTRLPVGPRKLRGASEIGWSVQGDGTLADVIDLLFILQESPHLHRVENLVLASGDAPGLVKVRFRFVTLVLEPTPAVERKDLPPKFTLEGPHRHLFDGIVSRDLLRPYIKRPPPLVAAASPPSGAKPPTPRAPTGPENFKIVSLSEWMGQPEVHVRDLTSQKMFRYKPGDALAGGTIILVDYRPMPMPGDGALQSFSRVIVKIDSDYWAIERGKTMAEKRKLPREQWPAELAQYVK